MKTVREIIYETIKTMGALTSQQVRDLHPELNPSTISSSLNYLLTKSYLKATQVAGGHGSEWAGYFLYEVGAKPLEPRPVNGHRLRGRPRSSANKTRIQTEAGAEATITELKARVAELENWKAEAIERFPDLAVPEATRKARDLVAQEFEQTDKQLAQDIRAGRRDGIVPMRVALKILQG